MRERVLPHLGQRSGHAAMFRVTVTAGKWTRTFLPDRAVQLSHIKHLSCNIGVTSRAAICHAFSAQRKNVTIRTRGNLRMRSHPAVGVTRLRIQSARRKHLSAAEKGKAQNYTGCDKYRDNSRDRKTSKSVTVHDVTYLSNVA